MEQEQRLGIKTFCYYFYKKIATGIVLLIASIIILSLKKLAAKNINLFFSVNIGDRILNYLTIGFFVVSFLILISGVFLSWIKYTSHTFVLDDLSLIIRRGIFGIKTVSIPYKKIQDISIEQTFPQRLMGVCKLVILTAGNDNNNKEGEAEGIFKIIDIDVAKNLQNTILQKK